MVGVDCAREGEGGEGVDGEEGAVGVPGQREVGRGAHLGEVADAQRVGQLQRQAVQEHEGGRGERGQVHVALGHAAPQAARERGRLVVERQAMQCQETR